MPFPLPGILGVTFGALRVRNLFYLVQDTGYWDYQLTPREATLLTKISISDRTTDGKLRL